jgi:hypothetical protein
MLDLVGRLGDEKVSAIAEKLHMTAGALSLSAGLIIRKNLDFHLTAQGAHVYTEASPFTTKAKGRCRIFRLLSRPIGHYPAIFRGCHTTY